MIILYDEYNYYSHFTDKEPDSEKQVRKLRVTANKNLSQVWKSVLSRDLES